MSRCKLISPVLLQLERPMLSPVDEVEFVIVGVKEHERSMRQIFAMGFVCGASIATLFVVFAKLVAGRG